jgi:dihydrofolate reductase
MRQLSVFNQISVDGYFKSADGDIRWLHQPGDDDPEFRQFTIDNSASGGLLLFGRKTFETMASFWPTPAAAKQFPEVARHMNESPKVVFSKTLAKSSWQNTTIVAGDPVGAVKKLKAETGAPIVILGSGTIVSLLTHAGLIDEYQILVIPTVLSEGTSMFDGAGKTLELALASSRTFRNGKAFLVYRPKD